ncbi:MAG: S8 family peptidase [Gemmataceae bacterium]
MPPAHQFEHLPLLVRFRGPANIRGGGSESPQARTNKANRGGHSAALAGRATAASGAWKTQRSARDAAGAPPLPDRMPLLLQIDPNLDLTFLREKVSFEVVAEQADGYVIVATEDIDLVAFRRLVADFATSTTGSANVARIFELTGPEDQDARLRRILSESLYQAWPTLDDQKTYTVDVGIECQGNVEVEDRPERHTRETDAEWAARQAAWTAGRQAAYLAWDELQTRRETEVRALVAHPSYEGNIISSTSPNPDTRFPDHFTVRLELKGVGLRDLVLNYSYIFEVAEPDEVENPTQPAVADATAPPPLTLNPPAATAPTVCVIDSGIPEGHRLLDPAVDREQSRCFLPGRPANAVADEVRPNGHGTRVAGAVLYGETPPDSGVVDLCYWVQNARVLDENCRLPRVLFPPEYLRAVVDHFHKGKRKTRIFNHSINASGPCRTAHMSAWAAEIDLLSLRHDVLFVVSAGNILESNPDPFPGLRQLLGSNQEYPAYLHEPCCRIASPAQSLQALTVGSVAYDAFDQGGWKSIAAGRDHASAFSRCGFGIWDAIKPEVVEYGGDNLLNTGHTLTVVGTPPAAAACYPDLVASTMHGRTQAHGRDGTVGTSFAAPKVSRIAAELQRVLPEESCLLYRALIVQSARWPAWARDLPEAEQLNVLRRIGYGVPDLARATTNDDYRVTVVSKGDQAITPNECHVFQVPIPPSMRRQGDEYEIRIDVTLSYVAQPKRTRRSTKRYLSTWLEWKASKLGQSVEDFRSKALKDQDKPDGVAEGTTLPWTLGAQSNHGISGAKRNAGTVQKDWAVVKSYKLPDHFCVAVIAHKGWNNDPDATARYSLAVTFEVVNQEIKIYDDLMAAVHSLQQEIDLETEESEAEVQA